MATDLYSETIALGGTIGGEHGDGLSRSPFIRQQYAELYPVFQQVKRIFDPLSILNPGTIICEEKVDLATNMRSGWNGSKSNAPAVFRTISTTETVTERPDDGNVATLAPPNSTIATPPLIDLHLNWNNADILNETKSCNGCGVCRTQLPDQRMCPIFRIGPGEEASPRAKANAMRGILTGELDPQSLKREEMKDVADLCVNCQQCRFECPAGVDIPKLMIEAKAGYVTTNGLGWRNWFLANVDRLASWASSFATVVNWTLRNRQMRWLFERVAGLAHNRKLPRFSNYTFTRWASRRKLTRTSRRTDRKVLYFADTYVNYFDPQLGQAFTLVCEHNGVSVYVPPEPLHSSMPQITAGAIETVRKDVTRLISRLADSVRQGYTIVATEPSTVVCLTQHYPAILDDEDSRLVAKNTFEACDYLWRIHQQGELQLDLRPIHATVGYHLPCHSRATHSGSPAEQLMRLITGLQVQRIEKGCSGMAGTYGLNKSNFRNSLRAGRDLISAIREKTIQVGATECSACKMQMEQGASKRTIHPLKWLANSYGLMPELDDLWNKRVDERVVS
jgi:Fe-S oxidoreductase